MEKEKIITSQNVHLYYGQKEALKLSLIHI